VLKRSQRSFWEKLEIETCVNKSVERTFLAMNIIKRELRNKIEDDWMNDLMVCYMEKEIFMSLVLEFDLQDLVMKTKSFSHSS
jgi:hypothetical protein